MPLPKTRITIRVFFMPLCELFHKTLAGRDIRPSAGIPLSEALQGPYNDKMEESRDRMAYPYGLLC